MAGTICKHSYPCNLNKKEQKNADADYRSAPALPKKTAALEGGYFAGGMYCKVKSFSAHHSVQVFPLKLVSFA